MDREREIQALVEIALESGRSPEEACRDDPELIDEVSERLRRVHAADAEIDLLFPPSAPADGRRAEYDAKGRAAPRIEGYVIEHALGMGGLGIVFKARHIALDRPVAIKMLLVGSYATPQEVRGLIREAKAVAAVDHPNIVQVHDVGDVDGQPYFAMEFVGGGSLAQKLSGEPQAAMKSADWVSVLAHAVQAAHDRGIVHRDLKPANVLVTTDGTLKITDFGVARRRAGSGETAVTITAARVGTPSYMSPEQALGTADAFKPAADIYSLGAILYEMLTGRPPFRGESGAETERQVLNAEPVPPSRLNPKTPRDLQTICLKCLQKQPDRRYPSAEELAEDLDRFRKGEPIRARPVGAVEQAIKWARRRPAHAALAAAVSVVIVTGFVFGLWYQSIVATRRAELGFRESEARGAIRSALDQAAAATAAENWKDADLALSHAKERTAEANSEELDREIESLGGAVRVARVLEQARQSRVLGADGNKSVAESYAAAFQEAGVPIDGDARASAAPLRLSPIRTQLIAALDDWASVEHDLRAADRCERLLAIAREADPGSAWKARFRTPALWADREGLLQLAVDAATEAGTSDGPAVHQIGLLGLRLGETGSADAGMELLKRVLVQRPTDFWMNWALGLAYLKAGRYQEAISPTRTAMALRPENAFACAFLAGVLSEAGDLDEGIPLFHRAIALAPDTRYIRRNLVYILCKNGRIPEAKAVFSWWKQLDPQGVSALRQFVWHTLETHRYEETIDLISEFQKYDTTNTGVLEELGDCLYELGRLTEAEAAFREDVRLQPDYGYPHARLYRILFKGGRIDEAIVEGQAAVQRSVKVSSLQHPLGDLLLARGRLPEASAAFEQATRESPSDVAGWIGVARTQLGLRELVKARTNLDHAATLSPSPEQRQQLARLNELHNRISELDARDPALLAAPSPASDAATLRDLAEWNWRCAGNAPQAVRQYLAAFSADPQLVSAAGSPSRYHAACSALAAAEPLPSPNGEVSPEERSRLQELALDWLSSERDALLARRNKGDGPERAAVGEAFRSWLAEPVIAIACNTPGAGPAADKVRWQQFWSEVREDAALDNPGDLLTKARVAVSLSNWARASECYSELFRLQPDQIGDVWFERAAVQLLANDMEGYRSTCTTMFDSQGTSSRIRAYHVARACTLAPLGDSDLLRAAEMGAREIRTSDAAWALTEKGALFCRSGQSNEAIGLLKRSIDVDPRVGMAVLNWFWLAIANDQAGHPAESRRWFTKADTWLQRLGGERPPGDGPSAIHIHNWLEAHILHREAAAAVASRGVAG